MSEKYLLEVIEEIIEANEVEKELIEYFKGFNLVNKYNELGEDGFYEWIGEVIQ